MKKIKEFGIKDVLICSSKGNIASSKLIKSNKSIFIKEDEGSKYYKISNK